MTSKGSKRQGSPFREESMEKLLAKKLRQNSTINGSRAQLTSSPLKTPKYEAP